MREGFDDTGDLEQVLRLLPAQGLLAPAKPGWRAVMPMLPTRQPRYTIRVQRGIVLGFEWHERSERVGRRAGQAVSEFVQCVLHSGTKVHVHQDRPGQHAYEPGLHAARRRRSDSSRRSPSQAHKDASFKRHNAARSAWAKKHHTGELVVYFRYGTSVRWNDQAMTWVVGPATFAFSGGEHEFVAMNQGTELVLLAHEMGHYFHLPHTFGTIASLTDEEKAKYDDPEHDPADHDGRRKLLHAKVIEAIRGYVDDKGHPPEQGLNVFDADTFTDTAPDPGTQIFHYEFKDACGPKSITVDVPLKTGARPYTLDPDRDLIMSYFFRCPGGKRFSEQPDRPDPRVAGDEDLDAGPALSAPPDRDQVPTLAAWLPHPVAAVAKVGAGAAAIACTDKENTMSRMRFPRRLIAGGVVLAAVTATVLVAAPAFAATGLVVVTATSSTDLGGGRSRWRPARPARRSSVEVET